MAGSLLGVADRILAWRHAAHPAAPFLEWTAVNRPHRRWAAVLAALAVGLGAAAAGPTAASAATQPPMYPLAIGATNINHQILISSAETVIPFTLTTTKPAVKVEVGLVSGGLGPTFTVTTTTLTSTSTSTSFSGQLAFNDHQIKTWKQVNFQIFFYAYLPGLPTDPETDSIEATVAVASRMSLTCTRHGTTVVTTAAVQAWNTVPERFVGWANQPVTVLETTNHGPAAVTSTHTDRNGNVSIALSEARGVGTVLEVPGSYPISAAGDDCYA